jgi:hypothetical protein
MAETIIDKAKKKYNELFDKKKPAVTPAPATLGTGYAAGAAKAITDRNKATEAAAKGMDSYRKGGKVRRTGPAYIHKNEHVITVGQTKKPEVKKIINKLKSK